MILLDTHVWLWMASEPNRLGPAVSAATRAVADRAFGVSTISGWEVAKKVSQGKLSLDRPLVDWISATQNEYRLVHEQISMPIAMRAGALGAEGFHGDPADRIIVATALILRCALATIDDKIREWASNRADLSIVW
jgi:PIN domain nuclease of toxin-antitoxin system